MEEHEYSMSSNTTMGQTECETETRRTINHLLILWSFFCVYQIQMVEQRD